MHFIAVAVTTVFTIHALGQGALATQWVGCQRFDGRLLVRYRHLYIREIDLKTGRSRPILTRTEPDSMPGEITDVLPMS